MIFEEAITQYVSDHIDKLESDYQWSFPAKNIPIQIEFGNESWLEKNIKLRKELHKEWISSTEEKRLIISSWYIYEWGGVKTNKPEKLALYASSKPEQLILRKSAGIASWSKSLSVANPSQFAIFDARVSSSLNSIQIIKKSPIRDIIQICLAEIKPSLPQQHLQNPQSRKNGRRCSRINSIPNTTLY